MKLKLLHPYDLMFVIDFYSCDYVTLFSDGNQVWEARSRSIARLTEVMIYNMFEIPVFRLLYTLSKSDNCSIFVSVRSCSTHQLYIALCIEALASLYSRKIYR
jgi:hypothetical protein